MTIPAGMMAPDPVAPKLYAIPNETRIDGLCKRLSAQNPGDFWPGSDGFSWHCGSRTVTFVLRSMVEQVKHDRALTETITGAELPPHCYLRGQLCRRLLQWLNVGGTVDGHSDIGRDLLNNWWFQLCTPGAYPYARMVDKRAAYYSILCRLPSPAVTHTVFGPRWHVLTDAEESRWVALLAAVAGAKRLRNCLVGCMAAGRFTQAFHEGKWTWRRLQQGSQLYDTGAAVIRTNYELTQLAYEHDRGAVVYGNNDSICYTTDATPTVWEDHGFRWHIPSRPEGRAEGAADIRAVGQYRIGGYQTAIYSDCSFALPQAPDLVDYRLMPLLDEWRPSWYTTLEPFVAAA